MVLWIFWWVGILYILVPRILLPIFPKNQTKNQKKNQTLCILLNYVKVYAIAIDSNLNFLQLCLAENKTLLHWNWDTFDHNVRCNTVSSTIIIFVFTINCHSVIRCTISISLRSWFRFGRASNSLAIYKKEQMVFSLFIQFKCLFITVRTRISSFIDLQIRISRDLEPTPCPIWITNSFW